MNNGAFYSIGQAARIKGLSVKALRFYQAQGLIDPAAVDPVTGYRYYSGSQFFIMDFIKAARGMGASVAEIRRALDGGFRLREHLAEWRGRAIAKGREIERSIAMMDAAGDALDYGDSDDEGEPRFVELAPKPLITAPLPPEPNEASLHEGHARLAAIIESRGLIDAFDYGIGYEDTGSGEFAPAWMYAAVAGPSRNAPEVLLEAPGGTWLRTRFDASSAEPSIRAFNERVARDGLRPVMILQSELVADPAGSGAQRFELRARVSRDA
jgi:DNA-binding transcriptional MerR regulator